MTDPTRSDPPDPARTTWVGRATPPQPPPPPTDPYWPPVDGTPVHYVEYVHGYPVAEVRPPRPRRTGRNVLIAMLGIFGLCCIGGVALALSLNGDLPGKDGLGALPPPPPGLNTPVKDGQFTFVVTSLTCGKPSVGRSLVTRKAKGTYCLVAMSVENTGDESQSFSDGFQKLVGDDGTVYDADLAAGVIANEKIAGLWTTLDKGEKVNATVVFDVPTQAHILKVELHDSALSVGTEVTP